MKKKIFISSVFNLVAALLMGVSVSFSLHEVSHAGNLAFAGAIMLMVFAMINLGVVLYYHFTESK